MIDLGRHVLFADTWEGMGLGEANRKRALELLQVGDIVEVGAGLAVVLRVGKVSKNWSEAGFVLKLLFHPDPYLVGMGADWRRVGHIQGFMSLESDAQV
jgi:hypothetical protein